ncbi:hypothetical protein Smp_121230 [Schistosoma mansoni]|uniref:hypothetical protein n=1 Tax=Schistosoma mansoni TaxID=6183 RepID=UPI00022DC129|nr:hypothetical protein Smp_121230 [Schistosoma mansoni]|eukprot:XP_018653671.1 hypothetical protein Smp_121230 [Schistosoma mansoni]
MPQIIVECIVNVNLADNLDSESSKLSPTFWLLQESEKYLYFQWTPFDKRKSDSLKLNLKEHDITRQLTIEEMDTKFPTIGSACINEEYTITNHVLKVYLFDNTLSKRKLNYKRNSTGFHRMHIVNVGETKFHIDEALQKQEEIIITSYHENRFGLFELAKQKTQNQTVYKTTTDKSWMLHPLEVSRLQADVDLRNSDTPRE